MRTDSNRDFPLSKTVEFCKTDRLIQVSLSMFEADNIFGWWSNSLKRAFKLAMKFEQLVPSLNPGAIQVI